MAPTASISLIFDSDEIIPCSLEWMGEVIDFIGLRLDILDGVLIKKRIRE